MSDKFEGKSADELSEEGYEIAKQGDYDTAIEYLQKAIELDPDYKTAYHKLGEIYEAKKEYEAAIENLEKAFEKDPQNIKALSIMARCYVLSGKREKVLPPQTES